MASKRGASVRLDAVAEEVVRGFARSRGIQTIERRRVERLGAEAVAHG